MGTILRVRRHRNQNETPRCYETSTDLSGSNGVKAMKEAVSAFLEDEPNATGELLQIDRWTGTAWVSLMALRQSGPERPIVAHKVTCP